VLCRPEDAQALVIDPNADPDEEGNGETLPSIPHTVLARCEALAATAPRERLAREFSILEIGKLLQPIAEVADDWSRANRFEKLNEDRNRAAMLLDWLKFLLNLPPHCQGFPVAQGKGRGNKAGSRGQPDRKHNKKAMKSPDWQSVRLQSLDVVSDLQCAGFIRGFKEFPQALIKTVMEKHPEDFIRLLVEKEPYAAARVGLLTLQYRAEKVEEMLPRLLHPDLVDSIRHPLPTS
jgi:hypothetical protein